MNFLAESLGCPTNPNCPGSNPFPKIPTPTSNEMRWCFSCSWVAKSHAARFSAQFSGACRAASPGGSLSPGKAGLQVKPVRAVGQSTAHSGVCLYAQCDPPAVLPLSHDKARSLYPPLLKGQLRESHLQDTRAGLTELRLGP